ncbi:hypothetical protein F503_02089 [Ophiostoma piceae UAMH 11346]|uniref:DUF3824 domain-containing protein n=1 Tax=Ophiostoma piceae (strain UAMH 11346) TaxID=1262450 RepID=S3CWZ7_OPHP1|nr:hypothetical protein F503_02089 [Ophiostoma piceae UAMH 11346]
MTSYYESFSRERERDRDRDIVYSEDDDDRYKKTTVRRYKVGPERDHVERIDRTERTTIERESSPHRDPRRSSNNVLEVVDRREYVPDRPRSAFEVSEISRRSERERDYYGSNHTGRVVYEKTQELERDRPRDRDTYTRLQRRGDDQIVVESFSEDRRDDGHGGEVERWHRETEYYEPSPAPQPIVIRNRMPEQKIILQEAPAPAPVIMPQAQPGVIVIREKDRDRHHDDKKGKERHQDEYYYERRERREVGPYRSDKHEEEVAIERFDRRDDRPHGHRHRHRHHRYASDGDYSDGDDYYVKKTTITRHEESPSHHRKHLVEGALAGAGVGALVGSRRNGQTGELPENRGRKVIAGAALGALGTEVLRRAHSAYNERFGDGADEFDDRRSRSRSAGRHSKLKTGLGLAAAALAVAGAAKYMQSGRIDREERNRGRSLHRYSSDEDGGRYYSRSASRPKKSRSRSVAKVAAGTAAVAGIVHHFRSKSRQRDGKARSHSRIRTGAEIAAAGLAGAAAKKIYDKHQDKKEVERDRELNRELDYSDEYEDDRGHHSARHSTRSLSRSQSRSRSAHPRAPYPPSTADADELGLVEYGSQPLYADPANSNAATYNRSSYDSAADAVDQDDRHRRHRRHRSRRGAESDADVDESYTDVDGNNQNTKRTRSQSRLRNLAAGGAAAAAAAIGIKKYEDKKKRDDSKRREEERSRDDGSVYNDDYDHERHQSHDRHRRRDKHHDRDDAHGYNGGYYDHDDSRPPSPPHVSGGAYYPPAPPMGSTDELMQHPNSNISDGYMSYNPHDQTNYPPPPGPPPSHQGSAVDRLYGEFAPGTAPGVPSPHAGGAAGDVYLNAAGPLTPKADPAYGIPPPQAPPASYPQQPISQDHPRSADIPNPNIQPHPQASHGDDHVSAALPLTRTTAASAVTSLPPSSGLSKESINASSISDDSQDSAPKNVGFAPLSPQSSRTMLRHHVETGQAPPGMSEKVAGKLPMALLSPDTEHDDSRALILSSHRRHSDRKTRDHRDGDADVEDIPARFDSHGRPLSGSGAGSSRSSRNRSSHTSRRGDFEYKSPKHDDGWQVRGQWGIAGTDGTDVERVATGIESAIDGFGSGSSKLPGIFGIIGGVIGGLSALNNGRQIEYGTDDDRKKDKKEKEKETQHHYASSDDDRKRKRRNTYDTAKGAEGRSRRRDRRQRSSSARRFTDGYFFDHDGYDGQEARKRRRSWAS